MQIGRLLTRPCTITRRVDVEDEVDDYGDPLQTTTIVETVCELQQQRRREPGDQAETTDTEWALFLPAGTEIATADSITVDGLAYEMTGDPWPVRHPRTGAISHIESTVRRTA